MKQVEGVIKQILAKESQKNDLEKKISQLRGAIFGSESVDENLATKFYKEIAEQASELEKQKEILQTTDSSLKDCNTELDELKNQVLNKLTDVRFPLKTGSEGIQSKNNDTVFLFDREIENQILQKVEELVGIPLSSEKVEVFPNRIEVKAVSSIPDAMKLIIEQVDKIRKAAMNQLKTDDYVNELKGRDEKIQIMLYVLYDAGKPLQRKDMEIRAGLEPASLRGVLYVVEKRDPYLKKLGRGEFELTPLGKNVLKKYVGKYGSPLLKKHEVIEKEKTLENYTHASNTGNISKTSKSDIQVKPRQSGGVPNQRP